MDLSPFVAFALLVGAVLAVIHYGFGKGFTANWPKDADGKLVWRGPKYKVSAHKMRDKH